MHRNPPFLQFSSSLLHFAWTRMFLRTYRWFSKFSRDKPTTDTLAFQFNTFSLIFDDFSNSAEFGRVFLHITLTRAHPNMYRWFTDFSWFFRPCFGRFSGLFAKSTILPRNSLNTCWTPHFHTRDPTIFTCSSHKTPYIPSPLFTRAYPRFIHVHRTSPFLTPLFDRSRPKPDHRIPVTLIPQTPTPPYDRND